MEKKNGVGFVVSIRTFHRQEICRGALPRRTVPYRTEQSGLQSR